MKHWLQNKRNWLNLATKGLAIGLYCLALLLGACNNPSGSSDPNATSATPSLSPACLLSAPNYPGSACHYNYDYHAPSFHNYTMNAYEVQQRFYSGFCGCGSGFQAVYNNSMGLGCISTQYTSDSTLINFFWDYTTGNFMLPRTSLASTQTTQSTNGGCYNVLVACDPATPTSCGTFAQCVPVGQSRLGICQYRPGYSAPIPYAAPVGAYSNGNPYIGNTY